MPAGGHKVPTSQLRLYALSRMTRLAEMLRPKARVGASASALRTDEPQRPPKSIEAMLHLGTCTQDATADSARGDASARGWDTSPRSPRSQDFGWHAVCPSRGCLTGASAGFCAAAEQQLVSVVQDSPASPRAGSAPKSARGRRGDHKESSIICTSRLTLPSAGEANFRTLPLTPRVAMPALVARTAKRCE